jgi:hypothetical protein
MSDFVPKLLSRDQARLGALSLAGMRSSIGMAALLVPEALLKPWIGPRYARGPVAKLLGRALGGRDLALAAGPVLSMRHDGPVRGWIEAGMLADSADFLATVLAFGELPRRTRWLVLASTAGAAAAGAIIAASVDDTGELDDGDEAEDQAEAEVGAQ